ncbi:pyridoxal phosphate-dependent aminotransferase [Microlunatus sp. Y2014]|uniref:pyridoxal phosphate-dependent aminotransferase n=1 Tax=Microlunatus sp. Y2014 TaxID=3418488 RepID=UPI003DA6D6D9
MDSRRPSTRGAVAPFHVMEVIKAAELRQQEYGDAIWLCAGQPSTPAPVVAREAAARALRDAEVLGYTAATGTLPLRQAIAAHHRTNGVEVDADDVVVTTGSSGGFSALFLAAFDAGDTVAMARPGYPAYRNTLQAMGCEVIELDCGPEVRHQPTVAMLDALPTPPAGVIVASPSNPTGTIIDADQLAAISRWCAEHGCLLISDEIYHGISFGRRCESAWHPGQEHVVVIGSTSKYFSMTGWRLGWMLVPQHLRRTVELLSGNLSICPPAISQYAAIAALSPAAADELDGHVARYAVNREVMLDRLPALGITRVAPPDGAFYLWCDVSDLTDDSSRWCADALAATGVAMTPGIDFDTARGDHWVRLCFAGATHEIHDAFDRLERWRRTTTPQGTLDPQRTTGS